MTRPNEEPRHRTYDPEKAALEHCAGVLADPKSTDEDLAAARRLIAHGAVVSCADPDEEIIALEDELKYQRARLAKAEARLAELG